MLRIMLHLGFLILFLTAYTACNNGATKDDFPAFTTEQLNEMMKHAPQGQGAAVKQMTSEQMIAQLTAIVAQNPEDLDNQYTLAKLHYDQFLGDSSQQHCEQAIQYFSSIIDKDKSYAKGHAYYNRMLCYFNTGQLDKALADIDQFVVENAGRTKVNYHSMRAEILYQKGEKEQACKDFSQALVIAKRDSLPAENESVWAERCSN